MKRTEGSAVVKLLECVNPVKNKWRIRWDVIVKPQIRNRPHKMTQRSKR